MTGRSVMSEAQRPESVRRPAQLTGLDIEAELGRGAYTTVFQARRGDERYALKRPRGEAAGAPGTLLAFSREAALLACVDHPGVVRAYAAGRYEDGPALVTELLDGRSLADLLADGPLPQERVLRLATELAQALAAAHRTGLVHRDIKPHNIMVPAQGHAKLIDFGLAMLGQDLDTADKTVGTFLYCSPEQSGMLKRPVDGRSDLYSLGVVLFQCLTGRPPFSAPDVGELLRLHTTAPVPELGPGIDPALAEVVTRLLAKDPDDRYQSPTALLAALRAAAGGADPAPADAATPRWPLFGRDAEIRQLTERWLRARAGAGGAAVVRGPAGSGRSSLAAEVAAAAAGATVLSGRCAEGEAVPLGGLRAALEGHLDAVARLERPARDAAQERIRTAAAGVGPGLIAGLSPRLAAMLGDAPATASDGRDDRLLAAVAVFLSELARAGDGLLLVLDDVQWLDAASRRVLAMLGPDLATLPLLVLLTELDGAARPLTELGAALDTTVRCEPLGADATAALIASRLPGARVPDALVAHVAALADGSPLAQVAYLLQLVDAGLLVPLWGEWYLDAAGAEGLPVASDAGSLIVARLEGVADDVREVLAAASVVGGRFRQEVLTAVCGLPAGTVAAALGTAVIRRIVEIREGGRYGFVHTALRDALLADVAPERRRRLHAAAADALDVLPLTLRDTDHEYVLARHHRHAGDAADPDARRRSALAAGRRALADQAPAEAIEYLTGIAGADGPAGSEVLRPLAVAYLRAGHFAECRQTLERALATETDRQRRAELRTTLVELHHTTWADDRAVHAATEALHELGRPLPASKPVRLLSTLALAAAGAFVRRTGIGYGTAKGRRRDDLAALAAVLDAGGYAAALGMRLREAAVFTLRALYAINRIGLCPEYVRVYALIGYVVAMLRLHGTAERCLARAARDAEKLRDRQLIAYVDWIVGLARLFAGIDDGSTYEKALARHSHWFHPAQMLPGMATTALRLMLRGYTRESKADYERSLRRLVDPSQVYGTSFSMLGVMIPAQLGLPAEAAAADAAMREALPPGVATPVQTANMATAALCAAVEEGEFGSRFDEIVAEFEGLNLRKSELMAQLKWFYVWRAHGRMAQVRLADEAERPARLLAAEQATRELGRVASTVLLRTGHRTAQAALLHLRGEHRKAIALADKVERDSRALDAPLVSFEVARIRARALRALGHTGEAERQARIAHLLAETYGWEHRRRQVCLEFAIDETRSHPQRADRDSHDGRNRRLDALQQVSVAGATVLDPQRLARVALDETLRILGAERAMLFLVDEAGAVAPFAGRDAAGEDLDTVTGYGSTLVQRVIETGEALVVAGTEQGAALGSQSVVVHGLRSIMVAPVQFKGRTLGVAYLDSRMARGIFTEDDVEVLTAITSHVAVSLETARAAQLGLAVQTARHQQQLAETLRSSLAELSAILDPAQVLHRLFATLHTHVGATAGGLLLAGEAGMDVVAVAGAADPALHGSWLVEGVDPMLAAACAADRPVMLPASPELRGRLLGDAQVALAVPLVSHDGLVGVVLLGGDGFDDTAREVAAALASQGMSAYANAGLFARVQELATTDELTGVHNRRHFYSLATTLLNAAARNNHELAAVMLDIDNFKAVNDTYGHGVGDDVIREVARRVTQSIRVCDVLGRYGGEEFAVILPDLDEGGPDLAERIREAIADTPVPTRDGALPVTVSVGITHLHPDDDGLDQVLARADHALYRAKQGGRNRVEQA
ncbi:diguanylate cyclase [Couchioplanes azureus]|uniref:diguanylate cyclase n=1 Tax=Couchioplanes caeruleus TaxID=56438 RepID=UPI001E59A338|nr:diguanylate cyclase [Couchioplanes caeruleus]